MKRLLVILLVVSLSPAITLAQKKDQVPTVPTPAVYRGVADPNAPPDAQNLADTKWFDLFHDEKLKELIRESLIHNYNLREAVARVDLARANLGITRADQFPTLTAGADLVTIGRSRDGEL